MVDFTIIQASSFSHQRRSDLQQITLIDPFLRDPAPVLYLWHVLAMLAHPLRMLLQPVAQVLREVSKQTNEVAGDGTTTATVLADAMVQQGLACLAQGANPVELVHGLQVATAAAIEALGRVARPVQGFAETRAVAIIAANDELTGNMVAEALERDFERVQAHGAPRAGNI